MTTPKEFYMKNFGDEPMAIHSECVLEACLGMINNTELIPQVFEVASWLHDMGRKFDKETHHEKSLIFLNQFLEENPSYNKHKENIEDAILNHRRTGSPKTIYGKIMQAADKVSLYNKKWIEYKNQY